MAVNVAIGKEHYQTRKLIERILCFCLVIPFCEPSGLAIFLPFSWNILVLIDGTVLLICVAILKRIKACYFYIGMFYISILGSTFLNSGEVFVAICFAARIICFVILINLYGRQNQLKLLFSTFKFVLGICILITLLFQLFNQDYFGYTLSHNYINFLTADNDLGYWYLPFTLIVYLSDVQRSRLYQIIDFIFWVCVCTASLMIAWSATCMVIYILFILLFVFHHAKFFSLINPFRSLVINIGISVSIVFFQVQNLFSWLIVDILHKDLTLSRRTLVWASAIQNIIKKPIMGYGTTQGGRMSINQIGSGVHFFSHNIFLEITIQSGLIGLFLYVIMYYLAGKELKHQSKTDTLVIINISLLCILLMQFSEFALYEPFANLPLILCFFYNDLLRQGFAKNFIDKPNTLHSKAEARN